mmetsp:Transcript_3093/g.12740  ORF Transcript_3093/g.12740 Transcript_3093/m.12740 type:complete len:238 (-) Transcript_3093:952-1665(-)
MLWLQANARQASANRSGQAQGKVVVVRQSEVDVVVGGPHERRRECRLHRRHRCELRGGHAAVGERHGRARARERLLKHCSAVLNCGGLGVERRSLRAKLCLRGVQGGVDASRADWVNHVALGAGRRHLACLSLHAGNEGLLDTLSLGVGVARDGQALAAAERHPKALAGVGEPDAKLALVNSCPSGELGLLLGGGPGVVEVLLREEPLLEDVHGPLGELPALCCGGGPRLVPLAAGS